jgi:hypothetical protein
MSLKTIVGKVQLENSERQRGEGDLLGVLGGLPERGPLGRRTPHVGRVGELGRSDTGAFGQATFGVSLVAPRDAADEVYAMAALNPLAEELGVAIVQFADRHHFQRREVL